MKKTQKDNRFLWSGLTGGLGTLAVFFAAGNLPIAIASGAVVFAASSLLFKKPKESPEVLTAAPLDEAALLEQGREGTKTMRELAAGIDDIFIVRGYLAEQFDQLLYKYPRVKFLENPAYNDANNISSAMCARYLLRCCFS